MAIATLTKKEQAALRKHGHSEYLEIGVYKKRGKPIDSITVECTKCGEVLVELIGGREQD